ncbi:putative group 1 glycosyl transferase [Chondrocystis sp. NIES-4102]|nr:putative group 1 glycosyl transferase [Chondrocystis sp. NIES-4102]
MPYKLLVVTTVPITIRSFLLPFVQHFKSLDWQVDGMAQGLSKDLECVQALDRVWDIQWSRNVLDPRNLLAGVSRVKEIVAQGNYDLVHVHTPIAAFVTRYALKDVPNTKVIYTAHGFHFYQGGSALKNAIFLNLEKLAGAWTDYLIIINQEDEIAAKKHSFLPSERIYYTRGIGVDTNFYASRQATPAEIQQIRQELNLADQDYLLLSIAEFTPRKRHRDLLNALAKLSNPHIHLALAGEGPLRTDIEQLAIQLDIASQVHFLGFRTDIPVLIQAAKAVLLVSQQEGLPRSIMEAMCLATPVIGSDIRGTRDLLTDGCGILVKLGDTNAIASAMAQVVNDPQSSAAMAQKAQAKMVSYDIKEIIKQYTDIYHLALAELYPTPN